MIDINKIPGYLKVSDVSIGKEGIFFIGIEQGEVLHDDGHQQVEGDVCDNDIEGAEEEDCPAQVPAIGFPVVVFWFIFTGWILLHTVMKNSVPIFSSHNPEQEKHSSSSRFKVCLSVDGFSMLQVPKEDDSNKSIAHDQDEHAHDDEEALVDRYSHSLHEHAECGVLASDGEEPQNDGHVAKDDDEL